MNNFLKDGYYGFYTNFYLEVVYLHDKRTNEIHNIFTKITAFEIELEQPKDIDEKFGKLNNDYNYGYMASVKSKEWIDQFLKTVPSRNLFDGKTSIVIGKLQQLNRQFVSGIVSENLNSILKCCYGNYVFEYFDAEKEKVNFILDNFEYFDNINSNLKVHKLDLSEIPERLGNILVVFPNGLIVETKRFNDTDIEIKWHPKVENDMNGIYLLNRDSETLKDFEIFNFQENQIIFTERKYQQLFKLIDIKRNLVLLDGHNCKEFLALSLSISRQLDEQRKFADGTPPISIGKSPGISQIGHIIFNIDPIVRKFQTKLKIRKNEKDLIYQQYGVSADQTIASKRSSAISHLIKLIEENGQKGVWIWDPYIRAEDIIELIVKNHKYDSHVKILGSKKIYTSGNEISGLDEKKNNETRKENWFNKNKKLLEDYSDNYGLNLEFRCAHSNSFSLFHDRFLIFPSVGLFNDAKVWSLGISVNQFGIEHHILQEVGFPDYIVKAFEKFWNQFENPENLVFKSEHNS
ncbi:MAG: hypothetical protein H6567_05030 [Lewinellaceae bacterium]|nr:hypothetical protein [Lewinellaceae bacterium]